MPTSERIYTTIKQSILSGQLTPGTRLVELALASELGASRTPIREALKRLTVEGFVVAEPLRGLVVRSVDTHEVEEFYQFREVLDGLAARLAAQRISDDQLLRMEALINTMEQAFRSKNRARMLQASNEFHDAIVNAAANRWLTSLGRSMIDFVSMLSAAAYVDTPRDREVIAEHRRILDALRRRDLAAAETAGREHIVNARIHFIRMSIGDNAR